MATAHYEGLGPPSAPATVQSILLSRVADDFRLAINAGERGYPFQTMTLCASAYELLITATFVGMNRDKSAIWLGWDDLDKQPWPRRVMEAEIFQTLLTSAPEKRLGHYAFLCWGKHGNPGMLKKAAVSPTPEAHLLNADPQFGNMGYELVRIAIYCSIWPLLLYFIAARKDSWLPASMTRTANVVTAEWRTLKDVLFNRRDGGDTMASGSTAI